MELNDAQPETVTITRAEYQRLRNDSLELLSRPSIPQEVFENCHEQLGSCAVCGHTELVWYSVARHIKNLFSVRLIECEECGAAMGPYTYDAVKLMRAELLRQPIRRGGLPL